jgi:CRISPR-associated protein (TIGR03984 family)
MEANGLCLMELGSETKPVNGIDERHEESLLSVLAATFPGKAFVAAWLHHVVRIGTWHMNAFHFHDADSLPLKHILKVRVFDHDSELLVWRTRMGLKARLRRDDREGSGTHVAAAEQVLFGTKVAGHPSDGYTEITEDRGTKLILPFRDIGVDDKRNRILIRTHNYLDNQANQATYADCRFVRFCGVNGDLG